jgi:hypothetical protein
MLYNGVHPTFKNSWYIRIVKDNLPSRSKMKVRRKTVKHDIYKIRKTEEEIKLERFKKYISIYSDKKRIDNYLLDGKYISPKSYKVHKWYRYTPGGYELVDNKNSEIRGGGKVVKKIVAINPKMDGFHRTKSSIGKSSI